MRENNSETLQSQQSAPTYHFQLLKSNAQDGKDYVIEHGHTHCSLRFCVEINVKLWSK